MRTLAAGLLAVSLGSTACFGPFNATRQVWAFNRDVGGKWAQEGVFLAFVILPVYAIASWADALIFNSIEFWTGDNPIDSPSMTADVRTFEAEGRTVTLARSDEGGQRRMTVTIEEEGCVAEELTFVAGTDGATRVIDSMGETVAQARTLPDGSVQLIDASGAEIGRF